MSYPEGVAGTEPEISGIPTNSSLLIIECTNCTFIGPMRAIESFDRISASTVEVTTSWTCPICGEEGNYTETADGVNE